MRSGRAFLRAGLVFIGVLLSAALIAFAFFRPEQRDGALHLVPRFAIRTWVSQLPSHLHWVLPFMALTAALPALRARVWKKTLPPHAPSFRSRFHALALGGLVHNAAPGRLGVFVSALVLARDVKMPVAAAFSSLLLAKLLELGALFLAAALFALLAHLRGLAGGPALLVLGVGLVAFLGFSALVVVVRRLAPRLAARLRARAAAHGKGSRLADLIEALGEGLRAVGSLAHLAAGGARAFGPVLASAIAYGLALRHVGVESYLLAGGLLLGALTLSQFTPGLPIGTGIYYLVCTSTARALGASDEAAAALAVLSHAATAVTHLAVGLASALTHHDRLRDLLRLRRGLVPIATPSGAPTTTSS